MQLAPLTAGAKDVKYQERFPASKLRRIDSLGAITLGGSNVFLLLFLDRVPKHINVLQDAFTLTSAGAWVAFGVLFFLAEAYWAPEPILPLRLLAKRNVLSSYGIQFLQTAAQMAVSLNCPST